MLLQLKKNFRKNQKNKICITYTCLSDNSMIINNMLWHQKKGVSLFIVFLEKNLKEFLKKCKNVDNIIIIKSGSFVPVKIDPIWVLDFYNIVNNKKRNFDKKIPTYDAEKVLNVFHAAKISYEDYDFDWVISIDADELLYIPTKNNSNSFSHSLNLASFFNTVSAKIMQVRFETAELIPVRGNKKRNVFAGENFFISFPSKIVHFLSKVQNRILLALKISGKFIDKYISLFYFFCGYNVRNNFLNLFKNFECVPYYLGYMGYKSAIRLPNHLYNTFSIHYWLAKPPYRLPKTINTKYCLHFDLPNLAEYKKKAIYQTEIAERFDDRNKLFQIGRSLNSNYTKNFYENKIAVDRNYILKNKNAISILIDKIEFSKLI